MKQHIHNSDLWNAGGPIPYSMTNDYMFRAVLQSNNKVLRGLISVPSFIFPSRK